METFKLSKLIIRKKENTIWEHKHLPKQESPKSINS